MWARVHRLILGLEQGCFFYKCWRFLNNNKVDGDYLEFGVYQGDSFKLALKTSYGVKKIKPRFWAFDSFQGLPEINDEIYYSGQFKCSKKGFMNNIKGYTDKNEVFVVEGWFDDTLKADAWSRHKRKASFIYIDCDLYESTRLVLDYVKPLLQEGALILFDDWYSYKGSSRRGEHLAFKEFMDNNSGYVFSFYSNFSVLGKAFIVEKVEVNS